MPLMFTIHDWKKFWHDLWFLYLEVIKQLQYFQTYQNW